MLRFVAIFGMSALFAISISTGLCFAASKFNRDPSIGGAYAALAVILSPFVAVIGGAIGVYFLNK